MSHLLFLFNAAHTSPTPSLFILSLLTIVNIVGFHHLKTNLIGKIGHLFTHQTVSAIQPQLQIELRLDISIRNDTFVGENTGQISSIFLRFVRFQLHEISLLFNSRIVLRRLLLLLRTKCFALDFVVEFYLFRIPVVRLSICSLPLMLNLPKKEIESHVLHLLLISLFEHGDAESMFGLHFDLLFLQFLQPFILFCQFALQIEVLVEDKQGVASQQIDIPQHTRQQCFPLSFLTQILHLPHLPDQMPDIGQRIPPEISNHQTSDQLQSDIPIQIKTLLSLQLQIDIHISPLEYSSYIFLPSVAVSLPSSKRGL